LAIFPRQISLSNSPLAVAEAVAEHEIVGLDGRLSALLSARSAESLREWDETCLARSFAPAKRGIAIVGKIGPRKGTKQMPVSDPGLPLEVRMESTAPAEVTIAEAALQGVRVPCLKGRSRQEPRRVITNISYVSCMLGEGMRKRING